MPGDRAPSPRRHAGVTLALLSLLFAAAGATSSRVAHADDVADEAEVEFSLGAERYKAADFRSALQHFLASNRLAPNPHVELNVARCYEQLGQFPDAYRYYTRARARSEGDAAARIDESIARVAPNVAVLRVETRPAGAAIFLDRKDLGSRGTAPESLGLAAGRYRVLAELPGYEPAESLPLDVRAGETSRVTLTLVPILGEVRIEVGGGGQGAAVDVDGETAPGALVPCTLHIPPGPHLLTLTKPGFRSQTVAVSVAERRTTQVAPILEALAGSLVIDADERGAVVEIDGETRGFVPAALSVPVGKHHVHVSLKGFESIDRDVEVVEGTQTRLEGLSLVSITEVEAASRTGEAVEMAPASVTIIGANELRGMRYPSLWEAARGVRGLYLSDDRGYPTVGFRGFSRPGDYANRVLVLLDGQPMNDDWLGEAYFSYDLRTDLDDIERIEIIRGPGSVLYGTGAVSGVINLVTRRRDAPNGFEVGASGADAGLFRTCARASARLGDDGGVWSSVSFGHSVGRDFYFPQYQATTPVSIGGNARGVDGLDVGTWTGRAYWKSLTAQWSLNSQRKSLPTGQFNTILGDPRTQQTDSRGMVEVKLEPRLGGPIESLTRWHLNYYGYRGAFAHDLPAGFEHQTYDGVWTGLEQRFVLHVGRALQLTAGGEGQAHVLAHQYDVDRTGVVQDTSSPFQIGAGYVSADVTPTARTRISVGSRLDAYSTFGLSFNPRVAVIFAPYAEGTVKVLLGKAFRAPSLYESASTAVGGQTTNARLQPENVYSGEVELTHRFSPTVSAVMAAFSDTMVGFIEQRPSAPGATSYIYANSSSPVSAVGLEVELRKEWKDGWLLALSGSAQRARYVASSSAGDLFAQTPDPTRREVPNVPNLLGSLHAAAPIISRALLAMTRMSVQGPRFDRNDLATDPAQGRSGTALVWDLVLSGEEPRLHLHYSAGLYNLLDYQYSLPVSVEFRQTTILQNGRTGLVTASVEF